MKKTTARPQALQPGPEDRLAVFLRWRAGTEPGDIVSAEALNGCVLHDRMPLLGYLLQPEGLFLIIAAQAKEEGRWLTAFAKRLRVSLFRNGVRSPLFEMEGGGPYRHLFEREPVHDHYLVALLLGGDRAASPDLPDQARWNDLVRSSAFCSRIDYLGGLGPVRLARGY